MAIVIDPDKIAESGLSKISALRYMFGIPNESVDADLFLIVKINRISTLAPLISQALKQCSTTRAVFLLNESENIVSFFTALSALDKAARARIFDSLLPVENAEQIVSIIQSWIDGSQDERIALATVQDDHLTVVAHSLNKIQVRFDDNPFLAKIPPENRSAFSIAQHGRKLSWKQNDLDIDLEMLKYYGDSRFRHQRNLQALRIYSCSGNAIKTLRERQGLSRYQIQERAKLSSKQISRIENGTQRLTESAITKLARAHELPYDEYVQALLKLCDELQTQQIQTIQNVRRRA